MVKLNNKADRIQENFTIPDTMKQSIYNLGKITQSFNNNGILTIPVKKLIINGELQVKKKVNVETDLEVVGNSKIANWDIRKDAIGIKDKADLSLFDAGFRINKYGETTAVGGAANPLPLGLNKIWVKANMQTY